MCVCICVYVRVCVCLCRSRVCYVACSQNATVGTLESLCCEDIDTTRSVHMCAMRMLTIHMRMQCISVVRMYKEPCVCTVFVGKIMLILKLHALYVLVIIRGVFSERQSVWNDSFN